jgi:hypothetical protein
MSEGPRAGIAKRDRKHDHKTMSTRKNTRPSRRTLQMNHIHFGCLWARLNESARMSLVRAKTHRHQNQPPKEHQAPLEARGLPSRMNNMGMT